MSETCTVIFHICAEISIAKLNKIISVLYTGNTQPSGVSTCLMHGQSEFDSHQGATWIFIYFVLQNVVDTNITVNKKSSVYIIIYDMKSYCKF